MSPDMARPRAALRLALAATLALVWGTMAREPLPGLTAVLAAQVLVGMPRPPRPGQAATLVAVIARTSGGPALAPCHDAAQCHCRSSSPHVPSGYPGSGRARDPSYRGDTGDAR